MAKLLGEPVGTVMESLSAIGEFVSSPHSRLEEPVVRRLFTAFGCASPEVEEKRQPTPWMLKDQGGPPQPRPRRKAVEAPHEWSSPLRREPTDLAYEVWKLYGFSDAERDVWLDAGLTADEPQLAQELVAAGLFPQDLKAEVLAWTVLKRLRAGESVRDVARLLRTQAS